jgi:hypothetical protein
MRQQTVNLRGLVCGSLETNRNKVRILQVAELHKLQSCTRSGTPPTETVEGLRLLKAFCKLAPRHAAKSLEPIERVWQPAGIDLRLPAVLTGARVFGVGGNVRYRPAHEIEARNLDANPNFGRGSQDAVPEVW